MSNKLLPCPCCGSDKVKIVGDTPYHWVFCKECDLESGQSVTIEGATKKWNTRKPMEQILEKIATRRTQSFCDYEKEDDVHKGLIYLTRAVAYDEAIEVVKEKMK